MKSDHFVFLYQFLLGRCRNEATKKHAGNKKQSTNLKRKKKIAKSFLLDEIGNMSMLFHILMLNLSSVKALCNTKHIFIFFQLYAI